MQNHKYSLTELELMIPWEREIYITMLIQELREQKALVLREYNQQKEILHTAHKERKMMDKSKEKALVAFHENLQRKAEKMLNEQSIQRYQRA